jgi:hypothetical protein
MDMKTVHSFHPSLMKQLLGKGRLLWTPLNHKSQECQEGFGIIFSTIWWVSRSKMNFPVPPLANKASLRLLSRSQFLKTERLGSSKNCWHGLTGGEPHIRGCYKIQID